MVELVDTPDLGSGVARLGGSSPFARTRVGKPPLPRWLFPIKVEIIIK